MFAVVGSEGVSACANGAAPAASTATNMTIFIFIATHLRPAGECLPWKQHDLADVAALGDKPVGVARALEGKRLGDDGLDAAGLEVCHQRLRNPVEIALAFPPLEHVE